MSKDTVYKCDVCGEQKKPSNGWTLAFHNDLSNKETITFLKWNDKLAGMPGYNHLCGTTCEAKYLTRITSTWRGVSGD